MRILIIRPFPEKINIHSYNVQEIGLAKALVGKGHDCGIVFFESGGYNHEEQIKVGDKAIDIYWRKGINLLKNGLFYDLNDIISQYDVIQVHEYDQLYSWYMYAFSKKPVVVYHGPYWDAFNKRYNLKTAVFDRIFIRGWIARKSHILTKSELATNFLKSKGFQDVKTIGVGLDDSKLKNEEATDDVKRILNKIIGRSSFLYIGKIEERRNVLFMLEVFARVSKDAVLVLVGKGQGSYVKAVEDKISALHLENSVIWIKELNQNQLSHLYLNCKYFLFPTEYDIFGMVLLEAMYFGMTVFSSKNGGSSTLIANGSNGYILDSYDVDKWSGTINKVIAQDCVDEVGKKASETIKNNFLWPVLVDRFLDAYKAISLER